MARSIVLTALLAGAVRAVFAVVVEFVTDLFGQWQPMSVSFPSGSLGGLFAHTAPGQWREGRN